MFKAETKKASLFYGSFKAIKEISLGFPVNTVSALIGPTGCGKSTYLRLFNRMNDHLDHVKIEGEVLVDGSNIYARNVRIDEVRKNAGMIFQRPNPFPKSVYENVAYGLRVQGIKDNNHIDEMVVKSLKKVALWEEVSGNLHKSAFDLNTGQQQRMCIARALALEPSLILMDKPTALLDPVSSAKIEELIHELKKEFTIIIITHNLQQAGRVSDYTAFIYMGELIESNETRKMFVNPDQEKTQNYITGRFG